MHFIVEGVIRGKSTRAKVEASSEKRASEVAAGKGMVVERVIPVSDHQIVAVKRAAPVHRSVPDHQPAEQEAPPPISADCLRFVGPGQDPVLIQRLYYQVLGVLTEGERLEVLVVQQKPVVNISPDALAATNRRAILYRTRLLGGMDMDDFLWLHLHDVRIKEGMLGATVSFQTVQNGVVRMEWLPKDQARAFYRYAQTQEESAMGTRRERSMEEARAAAGGVTVNNLVAQPASPIPPPTPAMPLLPQAAPDLVARLRQLKRMLDEGLIDAQEYNAKKQEIMRAV
jgi:hypothetical protein